MQVITLTSDWGLADHYAATVKGKIISAMPGVTIIDITHSIRPFNLRQASYVIQNSYHDFPAGTIHILALNSIENKDFRITAIEHDGQFFIGNDNGLFSLVFNVPPKKIIELEPGETKSTGTFTSIERMIAAAHHLAQGKPIDKLGTPKESLSRQLHFMPVVTDDSIRGMVIYVDNYENVITNIRLELFEKTRNNREFTIECRSEQITRISNTYFDVPPGDIVALFNRTGYLEIAINQGNAGGLLGLSVDDPVSIRFRS